MKDTQKFASIQAASRVWVVGAVHGDISRLSELHDNLANRLGFADRIVYTGNYLGQGGNGAQVLDELVRFRRWFLSIPPLMTARDIVFLRGAQEEMWQKLLQLQFAEDPEAILNWMLDHGVDATIHAYGGKSVDGLLATEKGARDIAYWTQSLIDVMDKCPGHFDFFSSLKRAAFTETGTLLIVNTGLDVTKDLQEQADAFWWAGRGFKDIDRPYAGFSKLVRGYDPLHDGIVEKAHSLSIDAGCGFGGDLAAMCLSARGKVLDMIRV